MTSKVEQAYTFVQSHISDGSYGPGFRLVLGQIARELNMSVVPVREAIRRLEAHGLITFETNVGAQVALIHEDEYRFTMETLALVESAATAMAAPTITAATIAEARVINGRMEASLGELDPLRFTQLNKEFHSLLFANCPNPHILGLVQTGWKRLAMLRHSTFSFVPERAAKSVIEHEALLQLIEAGGSPLEIEIASRRHRTTTLDALIEHQGQQRQSSNVLIA